MRNVMSTRSWPWPLFSGAIVILALTAFAGDLSYSDRGDRHEGVIGEKLVSGAWFELIGVQLVTEQPIAATTSPMQVVFCLPEPSESVSIKVWEPERNYVMRPKQNRYVSGRQVFVWPRGPVLEELQMHRDELRPLVRDSNSGSYYPAVVQQAEDLGATSGYRLVFMASAGVNLVWEMYAEIAGRTVMVAESSLRSQFSGEVAVQWSGRLASGEPCPPGEIFLHLEGTVSSNYIDHDLSFVHGAACE